MRGCSVEGCEAKHIAYGYCGKHAAAFRRHGNPLGKGQPGRKRKAQITHAGAHKRVFYDRGKASEYNCVDCGNQAQEWSVRHDVSSECRQEGWCRGRDGKQVWVMWSTNSQDYDPRCKKCHRRYDAVADNRTRNEKGQFV